MTDIELPDDLHSIKGAEKLKAVILRYWLDRGYVNVRAETYEVVPGAWSVRSNLVNGMPLGAAYRLRSPLAHAA